MTLYLQDHIKRKAVVNKYDELLYSVRNRVWLDTLAESSVVFGKCFTPTSGSECLNRFILIQIYLGNILLARTLKR